MRHFEKLLARICAPIGRHRLFVFGAKKKSVCTMFEKEGRTLRESSVKGNQNPLPYEKKCSIVLSFSTVKRTVCFELFVTFVCCNQTDKAMIKVGDRFPDILGTDQDGNEVRRDDYKGRKVALYFYPKDNTSGCTAEACSLRDGYAELRAAGYEIIGVSRDSAKSHRNFREKYELPFPLIVDTDVQLNEHFGVWVEKSMYGRKYMGTERTTFLADEEGVVMRIIRGKEVNTKDHANQILNG